MYPIILPFQAGFEDQHHSPHLFPHPPLLGLPVHSHKIYFIYTLGKNRQTGHCCHPIYQRTLRFRVEKGLGQDHTPGQWEARDSNPGGLAAEPKLTVAALPRPLRKMP